MGEIVTGVGHYVEITLEDLIDRVKQEHGEDVDFSKVILNIEYTQFKCFGYDLFDGDDYRIEITSKEEK